MLNAGHCLHCNALIWRTATDPTTGQEILLWPMPSSRYVRIARGPDAHGNIHQTPGIGVCAACIDKDHIARTSDALPNGDVAVIETAHGRYAYWYSRGFGDWLRAHARDYLQMDEPAINALLAQWEADR